MPDFIPEIKPLEGVGMLSFGSQRAYVEEQLGKPEEMDVINDINDDYKTEVWHYWSLGLSLFFDQCKNYQMTCAEVDNAKSLLWGVEVFSKTEDEIIALFKEKGYTLVDKENHEWGEKRVSFDDAMVDLYFEKGKLTSVNFGVIYNSDDKILIFPN